MIRVSSTCGLDIFKRKIIRTKSGEPISTLLFFRGFISITRRIILYLRCVLAFSENNTKKNMTEVRVLSFHCWIWIKLNRCTNRYNFCFTKLKVKVQTIRKKYRLHALTTLINKTKESPSIHKIGNHFVSNPTITKINAEKQSNVTVVQLAF